MKKIITILITILILNISITNAQEIKDIITIEDNIKIENIDEISTDISSKEIILYNLTNDKIIFEKDSEKQVPVASLTKIMTAIVAIENIETLEEKIIIKSQVFNNLTGYAQAGFRIGWEVSYLELLYGVMLPSGADAVNAIVLSLGTQDEFIELMNKKAGELNLENTKFDNPIGMDSENNYSTAKDMAILLKYALKNEKFKKIFTTKEYKIDRYNLNLESTILKYSSNNYIDISKVEGAKSGFTDAAGLCLASISTINEEEYLLINLSASTINGKYQAIKDAVTIYDYFNENYSYREVIKQGQLLKIIKNKYGYEKEYEINAEEDIEILLENNIDLSKITYTYQGIEEINSKYQKGDKLGKILIEYEDTKLLSIDVFLKDELKYHYPIIYIIIGLIIISIILIINKIKKIKKRKRKKRKK